MAVFSLFNTFPLDVLKGVHNFSTQTFKVALSNTAPSLANAVLADITQIAAGNGYTAGGEPLAGVSVSQVSGVARVFATDLSFTAVGGTMADWRYAVLYNDTATGDPLIGYLDAGGTVSLAATENYLLDFSATTGILQAS